MRFDSRRNALLRTAFSAAYALPLPPGKPPSPRVTSWTGWRLFGFPFSYSLAFLLEIETSRTPVFSSDLSHASSPVDTE